MLWLQGTWGNQCKNIGTRCNNLLLKKKRRTIYKMMTKMRIERISWTYKRADRAVKKAQEMYQDSWVLCPKHKQYHNSTRTSPIAAIIDAACQKCCWTMKMPTIFCFFIIIIFVFRFSLSLNQFFFLCSFGGNYFLYKCKVTWLHWIDRSNCHSSSHCKMVRTTVAATIVVVRWRHSFHITSYIDS